MKENNLLLRIFMLNILQFKASYLNVIHHCSSGQHYIIIIWVRVRTQIGLVILHLYIYIYMFLHTVVISLYAKCLKKKSIQTVWSYNITYCNLSLIVYYNIAEVPKLRVAIYKSVHMTNISY